MKKSPAIHNHCSNETKRWFIGRVPPNQYVEYSSLNGFYSPKSAKLICETDLQCAGFTFKGTRRISNVVPEVYFFHYISENSKYLTTDITYPHWTTYIVGSRSYVAIKGTYQTDSCKATKNISR